MKLPFELISLDLDLTLLDAQHKISPRNLAAVQKCRQLGAQVIITSGRMYYTTLPFARTMELDSPTIAYNGAFIKRESTNEILLDEHLELATAKEIVDIAAERGLHLNYYLADNLYTAKSTNWSDLYSARTGATINAIGDLHSISDQAPTKLLIIDSPEKILQLSAEMQDHFQGRAYVTISNAEYLEFMPMGVDKGKALARVADYYNIAQQSVIAFGDAGNDLPAIAWAGCGVAMANAAVELQQQADLVAPPYNEDGVAQVLEKYFN